MVAISLVTICHRTKLHFFLVMRTLKIYFLGNFQIRATILLTTVTSLYITPPWLIYFLTGSLYLLTYFTHATHPQPLLLLATTLLFSVSLSLFWFCSCVLFFRFHKAFSEMATPVVLQTPLILLWWYLFWLEHWVTHHPWLRSVFVCLFLCGVVFCFLFF